MTNKRTTIFAAATGVCHVALAVVLSAAAAGACSNDAQTQLGSANSFALLALNNGSMIINSATSITGDVGYSAYVTSTTNQKVSGFTGTAYVASTATFIYMPATFQPTGGIITGADALLSAANASVADAASCYAALGSGTSLGNVTTSRVLTSGGAVNVYSMTSLNLNGQTLTLNGTSTDLFLFVVQGSFDWSQSQIILNGVSPSQVVWYFPNASDVTINKATTVFAGTILGPTASVDYHNPAQFTGAIIAQSIDVHSAFNICKPAPPVPLPM
jgi:hypothetical protein